MDALPCKQAPRSRAHGGGHVGRGRAASTSPLKGLVRDLGPLRLLAYCTVPVAACCSSSTRLAAPASIVPATLVGAAVRVLEGAAAISHQGAPIREPIGQALPSLAAAATRHCGAPAPTSISPEALSSGDQRDIKARVGQGDGDGHRVMGTKPRRRGAPYRVEVRLRDSRRACAAADSVFREDRVPLAS